VSASKDAGAGLALYELLIASRDELREANDIAKGPDVLLNQGELRGINALISLFEDAREVQARAGTHARMKQALEGGSAGV
jgi:hypothetical protein